MLATTILVDEVPVCVVRPTDRKDLDRFVRHAKKFLVTGDNEAKISHRSASDDETAKWRKASALHTVWAGSDEGFFGIPL